MTLIFLDKFNNYFNRKIIIKSSIEDYTLNRESRTFQNINFNPNDSVNTEIIINWDQNWFADYLLVTDENNNIISRWFITESTRTREGQYAIQLKRDTIADFKNEVLEAPTFIEKATVPSTSPLIYNPEGMDFNQIKKDELLLKDKTNMAWIVGYCIQDSIRHPETDYWTGTSEIKTLISSSNIPTWIKNAFGTNKKFANIPDINLPLYAKFQLRTRDSVLGIHGYGLMQVNNIYDESSEISTETAINGFSGWTTSIYINSSINIFDVSGMANQAASAAVQMVDSFNQMSNAYRISLMENLRTDLAIYDYSQYTNLRRYDGVVYKDGDHYYKIHAESVGTGAAKKSYPANSSAQALYYYRVGMGINSDDTQQNGTYTLSNDTSSGNTFVELGTNYIEMRIWREEVYSGYIETHEEVYEKAQIRVYIPQTREHVLQQPYDMFCIPYGELQCNNWVTNKDVALLAARTLAKAGIGQSNAIVYDVQLLPYCPVQDFYVNGINEALLTQDVNYTYITDQYNNKLSIIFWCRETDFTFDLNYSLSIPRNPNNTYAEDLKISSECDLYRLCSPNYNGLFDFNLAKNNGSVEFFNVDCTYKPFNPYIHITPNFQGLYGEDFDDFRGLICNGDFSIAILTDQWAQYELQNKNYQQIFNTKIGTLDAFTTVARNNLLTDTFNDVFNNNAAATFGGAMKGGTAGAIVTAANTTVNSGVRLGKGMYTINESNKIIKNQLTNNFNYTLGNIKALPASLAKTSSFTRNNKIFPFIEIYSATDEEKDMLKQKLKYDGMTVMRIGKLSNYLRPDPSFMRGQIIRLEGISDDTHILNDIYNEIKQGVYL